MWYAAETRVSRRRSYPVRPAYPPKTRQPLPGRQRLGKHRIRFKLGRLPPRLRDSGYFDRGQRQDSLRVPIKPDKLYFVSLPLGMHQHDGT